MNLKDTLKQVAKKSIIEYDKAKDKTKRFIEETRREERNNKMDKEFNEFVKQKQEYTHDKENEKNINS